jgi:hypothetical protein
MGMQLERDKKYTENSSGVISWKKPLWMPGMEREAK